MRRVKNIKQKDERILKTKIYKIDRDHVDEAVFAQAGQILRDGGLVAFPTETVYGLGANALDEAAAKKIYAAKGRPSDNPLIVHIADLKALELLSKETPPEAYLLADRFWPGPMTMVLKKSRIVPEGTTGGLNTVAIRMPSHPVALKLIQTAGVYVAAPSANTSGRPSPTTAAHVVQDMDGRVDMIMDGGKVGIGIESSIIDLTGEVPMVLRPGYITKEMFEEVLGQVAFDPAITQMALDTEAKPKAPGMKYKHYAPKGSLTLVEGSREFVTDKINALVKEARDMGYRVAVIATDETADEYKDVTVTSIGTRESEDTIVNNLYEVLRKMDDMEIDCIYSESFSDCRLSTAIMNRLLKAAGHKVITEG